MMSGRRRYIWQTLKLKQELYEILSEPLGQKLGKDRAHDSGRDYWMTADDVPYGMVDKVLRKHGKAARQT